MSDATLKLNEHEVEQLVNQLDSRAKIRLVQKLEKETLLKRFYNMLDEIDKQVKKRPISQKEIIRICEEVRKERYAQGYH